MGCTSSKQSKCRQCETSSSYAPMSRRSFSLNVHHPPQRKGDTYHVVALTSSTLDSIHLNPTNSSKFDNEKTKNHDFTMGMIQAKAWSKMIDEKIIRVVPKTPIVTPPGEPETINVEDLMAGLESTICPEIRAGEHLRSFSFDVAFEELSPATNPFHLEAQYDVVEEESNEVILLDGVHNLKKRLVLYFTSLRGVRKTYEDCCYVRVTLKGLGVRVDERDVSMHSGFKEELNELLDEGLKGGLPKVFVGEEYIGGVDEIRRLHEEGKLDKVVECCEMIDADGRGLTEVCEGCGDVRFIPCETCSGSCKIYCEYEDDDREYDDDEYGFQRCPDCNENGLVRCPLCCY